MRQKNYPQAGWPYVICPCSHGNIRMSRCTRKLAHKIVLRIGCDILGCSMQAKKFISNGYK
uniref:Uncharacterized protein n=1 Tax=Arundo donax TaxID=35708 RepID=A0A0A9FBV8_ARUDO